MGDPLTDFDRGIAKHDTDPQIFDERRAGAEIGRLLATTDGRVMADATDDVRRGADLMQSLAGQFWESDRKRRLYTKFFLVARWAAQGPPAPSDDQVYGAMLSIERDYVALLVQRQQERLAAAARGRLRTATATAQGQLQLQAVMAPMNPMYDFDDVITCTYAQAERYYKWVERGIADARGKIDRQNGAHALVLYYDDGATLEIPLHPNPAMFKTAIPPEDAILPFFRIHKASGRFVPFQASLQDYQRLPAGVKLGDALKALPPRFDPVLTPRILNLRDLVNSRWLGMQFGVLQQGFGALSMATGVTSLKPANVVVGGLDDAAAIATNAAKVAATTVRTVAQQGHATVVAFGLSRAAARYLGKAAWSWYCRNAVAVNTAAVVGADVALTLSGNDAGPNSADDIIYAAKIPKPKVAYEVYRVDVQVVEDVPNVGKVVKGRVTEVELTTAEKFDELFDSGKLIHHDPAPAVKGAVGDAKATSKTAVAVDDAKAAAIKDKAIASKGLDDKALVAKKPASRPRTPLPDSIHHTELLSDADVEKLVKLGLKPQALEKMRSMAIGDLSRMGLKAKDVAGLGKKIETSHRFGGVVVNFMNTFHATPGFEAVVLNWAKGGNARPGMNFTMKYALKNFRGQAIRFEWPVGAALTRTGEEATMAARYVDIVLDGGTSIRPGEALRIELKAWTDRYLAFKQARMTIARQLARDTAFFSKNNIKWVFDASKANRATVMRAFTQAIREDPLLRVQWSGTDDEIAAALDRLIELVRL